MAAGDNHRSEAERLLSQAHHFTYGDGADPVTGQALATEAIGHALLAVVARQEVEKSSREADDTAATKVEAGLADGPVRCPLCPTPLTLHTPSGARAHFTTVHPEQRITGLDTGPWPLLVGEKSSREADATPQDEQPITVTAHPTRCWPCMTEDCPGVPHPVGDIPGLACGCGCATAPGPDLYSIVLAAIGTAQGPQLPLPVSSRRLIASQVTNAVAPLVAYREVWDASLPPGGAVCSICGHPVESEPCPDHAPDFFQPGHTYRHSAWSFRCDSVTTDPDTGERVALGWFRFREQRWRPFAAGAEHWRDRWRDTPEPACDSEPPSHASTDTPGEGT